MDNIAKNIQKLLSLQGSIDKECIKRLRDCIFIKLLFLSVQIMIVDLMIHLS